MTDGEIDIQWYTVNWTHEGGHDMKRILIISAVFLSSLTVTTARSPVVFRPLTQHHSICTPHSAASQWMKCGTLRVYRLDIRCSTPCTYIGPTCMDCEGRPCSTCK